MRNNNIFELAKNLSLKQNVCLRVIDQETGKVVQEHSGHNSATNSLLYGMAHHLIGDFLPSERHGLNPNYSMLSNYVPRYISLGTMGLVNQNQDSEGLPAGIGDYLPSSRDPEYLALVQIMNEAKAALDAAEEALENECPYYPATTACEACQVCSDRIAAKKQARDDAQEAFNIAYQNVVDYSEEKRCIEYMEHAPGYGADGYSASVNNGREYMGLGYAWTSYDVTDRYSINDIVTYKSIVYKCKKATSNPAGVFDSTCWEQLSDDQQPSLGTTIKLELISPSFPRTAISYRDVVPEYESELPKTIDVVYSAMISTGALKQFRPEGQDYIFITEAGLWSKKNWSDGNENGLLAGYRIGPPNEDNWDMTIPENRHILKENILKVGLNQVVQVVWKIQLGSIDQFVKETSASPQFHDIFYTTGVEDSGSINKLFVEKLASSTRGVYFEQSYYKRGCMVPKSLFDCDEDLYIDFVVNSDNTETIYWWTAEGEVNYRTPTTEPFYNLRMLTQDMSKWHFIGGLFTYIPQAYVSDFANIPVFSDVGSNMIQLHYGPLPNTRSNDGVFYYWSPSDEEYVVVNDWSNPADYIQDTISKGYPVITTSSQYSIYVNISSENSNHVYYCEDNIAFLDSSNLNSIVSEIQSNQLPDWTVVCLDGWDATRVTSLDSTFKDTSSTWNISDWDTREVTSTSKMFQGATGKYIGFDKFDLSNVEDASYMFDSFTGYIVRYDYDHTFRLTLPDATNLDYAFARSDLSGDYGYYTISIYAPLAHSMVGLFEGFQYNDEYGVEVSLDSLDSYDIDSSSIFKNANLHTGYFNLETVCSYIMPHSANISSMFEGATLFKVSELNFYDFGSNITDAHNMFKDTVIAGHYPSALGVYFNEYMDTSNITDMSYMFYVADECKDDEIFTFGQIQDETSGYHLPWNVGKVRNFTGTFGNVRGAFSLKYFNCSIGQFFDKMFINASGTCNVEEEESGYELNYAIANLGGMDITSNATSMTEMFKNAWSFIFPIDISTWNVSNVTNVNSMFEHFSGASRKVDVSGYGLMEGHPYLTNYHVPSKYYLKLPRFDWSKVTNYSRGMHGCYIPRLVMNDIHVDSNATLEKLKSFLEWNKIYSFVAHNWTFDPSITSLASFFSRWDRLCEIDLTGWDVSHVTDFNNMFKRVDNAHGYYTDQPHAGIIDYSSLDNWDVSAGTSFNNMCQTNLHVNDPDAPSSEHIPYRRVPCAWFNEHAFENTFRFPNWQGTWNKTGLVQLDDGYSFSTYEYTAYPDPSSGFGTYTPGGVTPDFVTLSASGIATLQNIDSQSGYERFIPLERDQDGLHYYYKGERVDYPSTLEEFLSNATALDTTDPNVKVYYVEGFYYCESQLTFSNKTNFQNIVNAVSTHANKISFAGWSATNLTSLGQIFTENDYVEYINLNMIDMSNITDMSNVFDGTGYCTYYDIEDWNTSNVINMSSAFRYVGTEAADPYYTSISTWDVSNVTNMSSMFEGATISDSFIDTFANWDVSNVQYMQNMFKNCTGYAFAELGLGGWDVSSVLDMSGMFQNCPPPDDISNWDVSNVYDFSYMFANDFEEPVRLPDLSTWPISRSSYAYTYKNCDISEFDLDNWDFGYPGLELLDNYEGMFDSAVLPHQYDSEIGLDILDLSTWSETGYATSIDYMFRNATGPQAIRPLNIWTLPSTGIFDSIHIPILYLPSGDYGPYFYNQGDILNLKSALTPSSYNVADLPEFTQLIAPNWNITFAHGADISNLFSGLGYLRTVDLSNWDVSGVENFTEMFYKPEYTFGGVLDFSSLDSWTNINMNATFTRMCASNLQADEALARESGYHAFEQGYRFPDWADGTWDTTGLQQVHIDREHYPYYYNQAGTEYDAYCFGTIGTRTDVIDGQTVVTPVLSNRPSSNSTFGTFIPDSTNMIYKWDLTQSLTDSTQSAPLQFWGFQNDEYIKTNQPASGEWVEGTGVIYQDSGELPVVIPINMLEPGQAIELDFSDYSTVLSDMGGCFISSLMNHTHTLDVNEQITWSYDDPYWISSSYQYDPELANTGGIYDSNISYFETYFANSTIRIEITASNGSTIWTIYRNGTVVATTPETNTSGQPFLPSVSLSSGWEFELSTSNIDRMVLTGLRVYQL